jgi:hypothetical protein
MSGLHKLPGLLLRLLVRHLINSASHFLDFRLNARC